MEDDPIKVEGEYWKIIRKTTGEPELTLEEELEFYRRIGRMREGLAGFEELAELMESAGFNHVKPPEDVDESSSEGETD